MQEFKNAKDYYSSVLSVIDYPSIDFNNDEKAKKIEIIFKTPRYIDEGVKLYVDVFILGELTYKYNKKKIFYYSLNKSNQYISTQTKLHSIINLSYDDIIKAYEIGIGLNIKERVKINSTLGKSDTSFILSPIYDQIVSNIKYPQIYVTGYAVINDSIIQPCLSVSTLQLLDNIEETKYKKLMTDIVKSKLQPKELASDFDFTERLITLDNLILKDELDKDRALGYKDPNKNMVFDILEVK